MAEERILGQNHILKHFENAIRMGKISHAYIINGEEGSGKLRLAVHFAKALQCEKNNPDMHENLEFNFVNSLDTETNKDINTEIDTEINKDINKEINKEINKDINKDINMDINAEIKTDGHINNSNEIINTKITGIACGVCHSCRQTDSRNQPDIKYITHEKAGIGVDEIREQINNDIDIKPYSSRYKIYIVPDSEKMTVQAQNALLKTIEEPPEYAIIILLTTNADTFLQTILSRCVLLNVKPVKEEIIKNQLTSEYGISDYEAKVATAFSGGNPGKAIKLATSDDFKDLKNHVTGAIGSIKTGGMDVISQCIKSAGEFKKQIDEYFSLLRIWFRDVLIYKSTNNSDILIFQDDYRKIEEMSDELSYYDIDIILKSIEQAQGRINSNVNFDVTMEVLFLSIKERFNNLK